MLELEVVNETHQNTDIVQETAQYRENEQKR